MPTVVELSDAYANFMLTPQPGPNVCARCFNLTDGYRLCYACVHGGRCLDAMTPISYSVGGEQLHHALATYKRATGAVARHFTIGLAAVLWRWLALHEACVARATGTAGFALATAVPHTSHGDGGPEPLHELILGLVRPLQGRYERLLRWSGAPVEQHRFSADRYEAIRRLNGEPVLLLDDTWTTGANADSAAAALRAAGSGPVAAVVIGRHVNREWRENDRHLRSLPRPFDWTRCALCANAGRPSGPAVVAAGPSP